MRPLGVRRLPVVEPGLKLAHRAMLTRTEQGSPGAWASP
jgi:hypothetical protein